MAIHREQPLAVVARHQKQAPVDLDAICHDLGIELYRKPMAEGIAGAIVRDPLFGGDSGFVIYINSAEHKNRQRFTLAHEIAHYILHRDLIESGLTDDTMYRSSLSNHFEVQANRLAADILMPTDLIRSLWRTHPSATALARKFEVSEAAMKIRLESVNLAQPDLF